MRVTGTSDKTAPRLPTVNVIILVILVILLHVFFFADEKKKGENHMQHVVFFGDHHRTDELIRKLGQLDMRHMALFSYKKGQTKVTHNDIGVYVFDSPQTLDKLLDFPCVGFRRLIVNMSSSSCSSSSCSVIDLERAKRYLMTNNVHHVHNKATYKALRSNLLFLEEKPKWFTFKQWKKQNRSEADYQRLKEKEEEEEEVRQRCC